MRKYDKGFKEEAVKLSDKVGVKQAAEQLGLPYYKLADWRQKRRPTVIMLLCSTPTMGTIA